MLILASAAVAWSAMEGERSTGSAEATDPLTGQADEEDGRAGVAQIQQSNDGKQTTCGASQPRSSFGSRATNYPPARGDPILELDNLLGYAVEARVWMGGRLVAALAVLPGETESIAVSQGRATISVTRGERWCGGDIGFSDAHTVLTEPIELDFTNERTEVIGLTGGDVGGRAKAHRESLLVREGKKGQQSGRQAPPEAPSREQRTLQRTEESRALEGQIGGKWSAREWELLEARQATKRLRPVLREQFEQAPDKAALQTWKDVPSREIRVMTQGKVRMVNGSVGDENVTFLISGSGVTSIGEDLAEQAGASACIRAQGAGVKVEPDGARSCFRVIPRISFGSVSLENVVVLVEHGVRAPVLGLDLTGPQRSHMGRDGLYMTVGRK
ncbi:MAG: hypothetical protein E6R08_01110 [Nevskiaceae bacterium]|nr:MAG: hypothetical protein E6R08_01110 [Nevskiaceae bacterium]